MEVKLRREKRQRRHKRVRAKIYGTAQRPRLCVFRSNRNIQAQLVDDEKGQTLIATSDLEFKKSKRKRKPSFVPPRLRQTSKTSEGEERKRTGKLAIAFEIGKLIAKKAAEKKIEKVVFDRGGYKYHGRVKALAEGARSAGLKF